MKNYYEELGLSPSMSLEDIQDTLERERRKWANRTNSSDDEKRKDAENKVRWIDEALDGAFSDAASRKSYDSELSQAKEAAERSCREQEEAERKRKDREAAEGRKRLEEREKEVQRQKEAEEQQRRKLARKRRRRGRLIRLVIFLLIFGGIGYYYYVKHIKPVQEVYNTAEIAMNDGDYGAACVDYFEVNEAWFSRFLFKDAYDKGYEACTLWLGQEPVITTEEESPWWDVDENGGLSFDEDDFPEDAVFQLPTILDNNLITGIADSGFDSCDFLGYVELPANYIWIGEEAFYCCDNVAYATLSGVESIGDSAFERCSGLTNVTLNEGLTSIGEYAFSSCENLQSVTIPGTVEYIGKYAFYDCGMSYLLFTEGSADTVIDEEAFAECDNITYVELTANVREIGINAFRSCDYLTSVSIGDGCVSIGNGAFRDISQLTYLYMGQSLQTIGEYAFAGTGLYGDLYFPASMTSIGENAFENCESLTGIYTADDTANLVIQKGAFNSCDYLQGAYLSGVTQLGDNVFDNCVSMYWVELSSRLASIGSWCFAHTSLNEIHLGDGLTTIGEGAFYDNDNLTGIDIPASVGILEASTISECESLSWIVLREGITIIRDSAICYNANLREIYYTGDEASWNTIAIGSNDQLNECTYYFNYGKEG